MNPVAGSLTTTANAARENSIKGPERGNAILYRFWSHISTVLTLPRYFRSHEFHACIVRRAPTRRATYAPIAIRTWLLIPQSVQCESPAHRSIDLSSSHTIYSIDFFLSKVFEFQVTRYTKFLIEITRYLCPKYTLLSGNFCNLLSSWIDSNREGDSKFRYTGATLLHHRAGTLGPRLCEERNQLKFI